VELRDFLKRWLDAMKGELDLNKSEFVRSGP